MEHQNTIIFLKQDSPYSPRGNEERFLQTAVTASGQLFFFSRACGSEEEAEQFMETGRYIREGQAPADTTILMRTDLQYRNFPVDYIAAFSEQGLPPAQMGMIGTIQRLWEKKGIFPDETHQKQGGCAGAKGPAVSFCCG